MDRLLHAPVALVIGGALVVAACTGTPRARERPAGPPGPEPSAEDTQGEPPPGAERYAWQPETASPQPGGAAETGAADASACMNRDRALSRVAQRLAARELAGGAALEIAEVAFALRSEGAPYVWPRSWTLTGGDLARTAPERVNEWLASFSDGGERRCGIARVTQANGRETVAAVAVDVLADLEPLPTRVPVSAWLEVRARLLVPATGARVLVLGPRGRPHSVPASSGDGVVRARFRADREGAWLVQVLAVTESGPRPVAEAIVAAGNELPTWFAAARAPGEAAGASARTPADALAAMVNEARRSEGSPALRRDPRLDRIALAHAEAMRAARRVAHDLGDGTPADRVDHVALGLRAVGENIAHASDAARAHRSLWTSPAHRENLLNPAHELVGIGVAPDGDGTLWVCEIFADSS